nr:helix-turn-helix domain-containing protein [Prevotella intermedia]
MYKQLTSEQRSQFFALLQRKSLRKEIARIVGISQSTLSRELKRNGSPSGKYVWFKAHDKAMEVVSLKVCNSSFFSLYFHCLFYSFLSNF